jgi:hypothetical protein
LQKNPEREHGRGCAFFVYPRSGFDDDFTLQNLEAKVKERAFAVFNKFRGVS